MEAYVGISRVYLKSHFKFHLLAAVLLFCLMPFLMSTEILGPEGSARTLELEADLLQPGPRDPGPGQPGLSGGGRVCLRPVFAGLRLQLSAVELFSRYSGGGRLPRRLRDGGLRRDR